MAKEKQSSDPQPEQKAVLPSYASTPGYIPGADFQIEGQPGAGLRLYQVSTHKKKWIAQAEAQSLGLNWV